MNALTTAQLRKINGDMSSALLEIGNKSWKDFAFDYSMGASFGNSNSQTNNTITAWYNDEMVHISPIALNLVHMSVIQSIAGDEYRISVTNEPLDVQIQDELNDQELLRRAEATFEFLFPFITYIIMAILSAKYTSFYIEVTFNSFAKQINENHLNYWSILLLQERQCNAKFMQYVRYVIVNQIDRNQ